MIKILSFFDKKFKVDKKITYHLSISVSVKMIIILLLLGYAGWELYWYIKVGLSFVKWHTHLMPYVYIGLAIVFVFQAVSRRSHSQSANNFFLLLGSLIAALFIAESFFVITGIARTYSERINGFYYSSYSKPSSYYHAYIPGKRRKLYSAEFSFERNTNSMGFSDMEWRAKGKSNEKRIMALGDSFTEGDGAPYDSSYVSILRQELLASGDSFYVMNAGICGSDPFENYINLKDKLLKYKPDIIIQSVGSDDLTNDIPQRGGMERFQKDGTVKCKPAPWWEPIYALSYLSRLAFTIAGYSETLQNTRVTSSEKEILDESVKDLFTRYSVLCQKNGIQLIVVFHPQEHEVKENQYDYDFAPLLDHLRSENKIKVIDLLPSYLAYIEKDHGKASDYYWIGDCHHNPKGYKMMAETILQNSRTLLIDSISRRN